MSYLLDTNVLCELIKPKPSKRVIFWFQDTPSELLYISVLTVGEIRKGVEKLGSCKRQTKLNNWLEYDIPNWFENRILTVDHGVADRWGRLQHEVKRPLPAIDSIIAASALHHDLRIVTRNTKDYNYSNLSVIDPWQYQP